MVVFQYLVFVLCSAGQVQIRYRFAVALDSARSVAFLYFLGFLYFPDFQVLSDFELNCLRTMKDDLE